MKYDINDCRFCLLNDQGIKCPDGWHCAYNRVKPIGSCEDWTEISEPDYQVPFIVFLICMVGLSCFIYLLRNWDDFMFFIKEVL